MLTISGFLASLDRLEVDTQSHDSGTSPPQTPSDNFRRSRNMSLASTGSADSNNSSTNQLYSKPRGRTIVSTESVSPKRDSLGETTSNQTNTTSGVTTNKQSSFM